MSCIHLYQDLQSKHYETSRILRKVPDDKAVPWTAIAKARSQKRFEKVESKHGKIQT